MTMGITSLSPMLTSLTNVRHHAQLEMEAMVSDLKS
jgi:hypothetical protein